MEFREKKRWVFLGLPLSFTTYTITEEIVTIEQGFLNRKEDDCYMYKIQDVTLTTSLFERIMGLGTIICNTGDVTHPRLELTHIKNARAIKDFILQQSEDQRMKRRTLNTQNIGAMPDPDSIHDIHDDCGMPHMH
ncbi:PH domain-containing protein [Anaerosacchariphilus sp. NSJ-68]|mgnify:FL=1|uniref:PH domain-containing protein n=2 Tax=Lachnospiraceae TaxID=186803 RepID=A0A923LAQ5_9FIRM|nr:MULTISPECIES: PH domain-containing protein [Lachnospiraceae]MBC5658828.1 PH domain-containing protein [Anaerosacchariphilus hominis]MBC5698903.1 PH domain-containing protein [Roseburia difficilis]